MTTILSRELGRAVTVDELWHGQITASPAVMTADTGLRQAWSRDGVLNMLDDWVLSGLVDRRQFLAITGGALAAVAMGYDADRAGRLKAAIAGTKVGNPLLEQIEQSIPLLQRLDDAKGGGAHLSYVGSQFRAVAGVLRQGSHTTQTQDRLFASLAELGQLAGWMAFDAGQHGLAQRYFFTALRAAHVSGYRSMTAHILADLTFQAASCEWLSDAVSLGEAAQRASAHIPATVQASVLSRTAYGHAVAGDLSGFERAYNRGREVLEQRGDDEPAWMYYLTANHLDTQAGYALSHAGNRALDSGDARQARSLLARGRHLLSDGAYSAPLDDESQQRRAMFEGAWLAVAAAGRGDLEEACGEGQRAITRMDSVSSARSVAVLQTLQVRLRHRHQNEYVADFLPVLNAALT